MWAGHPDGFFQVNPGCAGRTLTGSSRFILVGLATPTGSSRLILVGLATLTGSSRLILVGLATLTGSSRLILCGLATLTGFLQVKSMWAGHPDRVPPGFFSLVDT